MELGTAGGLALSLKNLAVSGSGARLRTGLPAHLGSGISSKACLIQLVIIQKFKSVKIIGISCSHHGGYITHCCKIWSRLVLLKQIAYFSLVRPSAQYTAIIWDPHWKRDQSMLQNIQNRAVHWVCGKSPREQVSVSQLTRNLKRQSLEQRQKSQRLALMYKIVHGEVAVTPDLLGLQRADWRTMTSNPHKFCEWSGRTEVVMLAVHSTAWWSRSEGLWTGPVYPLMARWYKSPMITDQHTAAGLSKPIKPTGQALTLINPSHKRHYYTILTLQ